MAELKDKFEQHVSKSNVKDIIKSEKIEILVAATNRHESEMTMLKEENANQAKRIIQLEKKIILNNNNKAKHTKIDGSAPNDKLAATSSSLTNISKSSLPSSCKDLSTNGHNLNGIYLLYDSTVKKVTTAFCDFNYNNKGIRCSLFCNNNSFKKRYDY